MTEKPDNLIVKSRADLRAILQGAGLARAAADLIAKGGWAALTEEPNPQDTKDLTVSIQDLRERRAEKATALKNLVDKPNWNDARDKPKYDQLMNEVETIDIEMQRIVDANERIAADCRRPAGSVRDTSDHAAAFTNFLRFPKNMRARQNLADMDFRNTASGASDPAGGFLIPEVILGPLMKRASNANPFRDLVRVVQVATRDVNFPLSNANMTTGWVGENATRTATAEPTISNAKPTFGMLYSYVEASEELVMDSEFDIANWFGMEAGDAMGEAEMAAIISGNGTDKPSGLLRVAPEAAVDGSRTAGAFRYLPTGAASTLGTAFADLLITCVYDLKASYRARGTWVMNSQVAGDIRKLKDSQGRFLWTDGIAAGESSTLLGYPVRIAESMAGVAANTHPVLFGDFNRGYILAENGGMRVTVDDNITKPGAVRWYLRRRLGGTVFDNNSVRAIKVAST
ncbi:MAG: phage major capsid protein [Gemmobacter sp.]